MNIVTMRMVSYSMLGSMLFFLSHHTFTMEKENLPTQENIKEQEKKNYQNQQKQQFDFDIHNFNVCCRSSQEQTKYPCPLCNKKKLTQRFLWETHLLGHYKVFECNSCKNFSGNRRDVYKHIKKLHPDKALDKEKYTVINQQNLNNLIKYCHEHDMKTFLIRKKMAKKYGEKNHTFNIVQKSSLITYPIQQQNSSPDNLIQPNLQANSLPTPTTGTSITAINQAIPSNNLPYQQLAPTNIPSFDTKATPLPSFAEFIHNCLQLSEN